MSASMRERAVFIGSISVWDTIGTLPLGHCRRPALKSLRYFGPYIAASWDARRLARRLAYRVMIRPTGVPPSTRTFLGAPPTPRFGVSEARMQTPDAKTRRGNEMGCLTW